MERTTNVGFENNYGNVRTENNVISRKRYGELVHITRDDFLDEIDNEPTSTFIIVHLYETVSTYRMSY